MGESKRGTDAPNVSAQTEPMISVSWWPNSSSFCDRGVFCWSAAAAVTPAWMRPICVAMPVAATTPIAWPPVTTVPANAIEVRVPRGQSGSSTASTLFMTV